MAEENLKDFTINWILTGFLMFSLVTFAVTFMYNNNPTGLGDTGSILAGSEAGFSTQLLGVSEDSDRILNITSNTNPEVSLLGSRDSVATSFEARGSVTGYWEASKSLLGWTFSGTAGKMIMSVFAGIIGFLSYFYIAKHIRTGN